ncbi:MAG: LysR family transcriptional regulator [Desulfovibrionaceae bacterium]|nr:LysR family transcriptional regulator [Desulfovibrionaceae bacterium]
MDLRTLRYYLAVAREGTISAAAVALHVTQPTLSRQMMELEEELGKALFIRGKRRIVLTEEGSFLKRRAEEIVELADKTLAEFQLSEEGGIRGEVVIGAGETDAMRLLARAARAVRAVHPQITFSLYSGNAQDVAERLEHGVLDFGLFIEPADLSGYDFLKLPVTDTWGLLTRKDGPLAGRSTVRPADLFGLPLLISDQAMVANQISGWAGQGSLHYVAKYRLLYNAALMVEEGVGHALCLDKIARTGSDSPICFIPLEPRLEVGLDIVWKKHQPFSRAAAAFLESLREEIAQWNNHAQ